MASLELNFLGTFNVLKRGVAVKGFESNKVRALLVYLSVEARRPHSREALAGILWPDWPDSAARSNLRYALADLRKTIHDQQADPPFLLVTRDTIHFNLLSDHCLDVVEFSDLASTSKAASPDEDIARLRQALSLYRGEFLDGFSLPDAAPFEEWQRLKREQLHRQHLQVLSDLASVFEMSGNLSQALTHAWNLVEHEPWQESAQRQLMRLLALDGQRSTALAQFEACRQVLAKEFQVEPSFESVRLYESIRDGTLESHVGAAGRLEELPPAPGVPPFKGLQYFDEADAGLYFGREKLASRLVARLGEVEAGRFLAVVGASGSGKSSLVRAGLIPALRKGERLFNGTLPPRWSHRWLLHVITPTAHPLEALATSLTREAGPVSTTAAMIDDLQRDPRSLYLYALRMTHLRSAPRLLLVVDQFEELFTLCRSESERSAFVENLLMAAGIASDVEADALETPPDQSTVAPIQDGPLIAVIALRADFYAHCASYSRLRTALSARQEYIGSMSADELRRAIEEPAQQYDWEFEPGLVDLILREVSDEPGSLPLLSHALLETWIRRRGRTLTLKGYAEAGGIHRAIAQTAESVYNGLPPEKRELARRIFLRLTELGEGTQDTRRRASIHELSPGPEAAIQVEAVLNTLVEARLVTAGEGTVEVAHEALIREWPALRQWLNEDRDSLRLHRHLTEAAQAWEAMGRDEGELYRGARLAQAVEWARQPENQKALNAQEKAFLGASEELEARSIVEKEAQQRRELEAAQRAAEAERLRAEEQARSVAHLRRRAVYLVGALVLALVMAGVALVFGNRSASLAAQNAANASSASTQQALAEAEAKGRATQQALAEAESSARATAEAIANQEKENAQQQAELATSRELAGMALNNLEVDPERSILLALYGLRTAYTRQAEDALHRAVQASRVRMTLPGHDGGVRSVEFSPDGKTIATASFGDYVTFLGDQVTLWDANSGQKLFNMIGRVARYSPDGKILATGDEKGNVELWDLATRQKLLTLSGHQKQIEDVHFSPDGKLLAGSSMDDTFIVWDTQTGQLLFSSSAMANGAEMLNNANFSADGRLLVSQDLDVTDIKVTMRVWDVQRREELQHQDLNYFYFVLSPYGRWLAAPGENQTEIVLWDLTKLTGKDHENLNLTNLEPLVAHDAHTALIANFAFSRDGSMLSTASMDSTAKVWQLTSDGIEELMTLAGHTKLVWDLAFSRDGTRLATGGADGSARIWDITSSGASEWFAFSAHDENVYRFSMTADGRYLATTSADGDAKVWDVTTGEELLAITGHGSPMYSVAISPDGSRLATAGENNIAKIWKLNLSPGAANGELLHTLGGHREGPRTYTAAGITSVVFSPDGKTLATGGVDGFAKLWDVETGEELRSIQADADGGPVGKAAFSPDGLFLATASGGRRDNEKDDQVNIWESASGRLVSTPVDKDQANGGVRSLAFSPDGKRLAIGGWNGILKIWDVVNDQDLLKLSGHTGTVTSASFSPDGKLLATTGMEGSTRVWDAATGEQLHMFTSPSGPFFDVAFTPDGKKVIASSGNYLYGYIVDTQELIDLAKSRLTRGLTEEECKTYLHVNSCPTD